MLDFQKSPLSDFIWRGTPLATSSLAVGRFAAKKGSLRSPRGRLVASLLWCHDSPLPLRKKRKLRQRPLPAHDAFPHHVDSGVSLTTINVLVTCNATYRCGLCDNNCGLRNFKRTVSTGHAHSTLKESGFVKQTVSTTNLVSGYIRQSISSLPLSFLSFLSLMRELCYICRREGANKRHLSMFWK